MEPLFKIEARGSSLSREVIGGLTTFLAMVYIAAVSPTILAEVGAPFQATLTSTCLGAVIMALIGRAREVKPLMWVVALAFLVMFAVG